jgi:hypothetical protein
LDGLVPHREGSVTDQEKAEKRLLEAASADSVKSSASLLAAVEKAQPGIPADTVRYAYWTLVSAGKLERTARGVRKTAK